MPKLIQDVWYGLRVLRKSPGFTAIAVLAMGVGVGVNTSVFSLADVLVYRPLLVPDLDRLVIVQATKKGDDSPENISVPDLLDWRAQSQTVEHLAGAHRAIRSLSGGGGEPMVLVAAYVTPPFFDALGAKPELGRVFLPEEGEKGRDRVVVLNHAFWGARYGANPDILQRTIKLEGVSPCTETASPNMVVSSGKRKKVAARSSRIQNQRFFGR